MDLGIKSFRRPRRVKSKNSVFQHKPKDNRRFPPSSKRDRPFLLQSSSTTSCAKSYCFVLFPQGSTGSLRCALPREQLSSISARPGYPSLQNRGWHVVETQQMSDKWKDSLELVDGKTNHNINIKCFPPPSSVD